MPYLRELAGRRVVVKCGGEIVDDAEQAASLVQDLLLLKMVGIDVVLCHGGGPQISRMMKRLGLEPAFREGRRVTDAETMEITAMVLLGRVNLELVGLLNVHGTEAIGVNGADGRLFLVETDPRGIGYVGRIVEVSPEPVDRLLADGYLPVVASIGMDAGGRPHNINADEAAGRLAAALGAEKFVLLTNVEGLYESFGDEDSLVSEIDPPGLRALAAGGSLSAGMGPKVEGILAAVEGGVPRCHILDGREDHALLLEIFTPEGIGTMVTP
ncbi:MAG: acetylglutamate kinase [Acidimicrobiia bacterium]